MTKSKPRVLFLRGIDPEVKRLFKTAAVKNDAPMNEVVEALMRAYVLDPRQFDNCLRATRTMRGK